MTSHISRLGASWKFLPLEGPIALVSATYLSTATGPGGKKPVGRRCSTTAMVGRWDHGGTAPGGG